MSVTSSELLPHDEPIEAMDVRKFHHHGHRTCTVPIGLPSDSLAMDGGFWEVVWVRIPSAISFSHHVRAGVYISTPIEVVVFICHEVLESGDQMGDDRTCFRSVSRSPHIFTAEVLVCCEIIDFFDGARVFIVAHQVASV
jgi:hypothetical protein